MSRQYYDKETGRRILPRYQEFEMLLRANKLKSFPERGSEKAISRWKEENKRKHEEGLAIQGEKNIMTRSIRQIANKRPVLRKVKPFPKRKPKPKALPKPPKRKKQEAPKSEPMGYSAKDLHYSKKTGNQIKFKSPMFNKLAKTDNIRSFENTEGATERIAEWQSKVQRIKRTMKGPAPPIPSRQKRLFGKAVNTPLPSQSRSEKRSLKRKPKTAIEERLSLLRKEMECIVNPQTGRLIQKGGRMHRKLIRTGVL